MILRLSLFERLLHRMHLMPVPVMDAFGGVLFGRTLAVAVRKGVFELLEQQPMDAKTLATRAGLSQEGARLLLEACATGGYLRLDGTTYRNTAAAKRWLLRDSPHSIYYLVLYFETLHHRWLTLESSLEHGKPPTPYYASFGDEEWKTYVYGMRDLARLLLPNVMKRVTLLPSATRMLDLGGSHGLYCIALCERHPALHAEIIDFPGALAHTEVFVRNAGMSERIRLREGNLLEMPLEAGQYDALLLFNVIHGFSDAENRLLVSRALNALRSGGKCYILDQFRMNRRATPLGRFLPLMVGLNLLNETGGTAYSFEEIRAWCGDASARLLPLRLPGVGLIEMEKR